MKKQKVYYLLLFYCFLIGIAHPLAFHLSGLGSGFCWRELLFKGSQGCFVLTRGVKVDFFVSTLSLLSDPFFGQVFQEGLTNLATHPEVLSELLGIHDSLLSQEGPETLEQSFIFGARCSLGHDRVGIGYQSVH